jgi:B12-binding domain/radical SAM domain protein of rhizo-twelve system
VNPNWNFDGSIYFGCRDPHLPLEFGYAKALLQRDGHDTLLIDAQMEDLPVSEVCEILKGFRPDITVVTTAPSYLFWRCPPPELTVPKRLIRAIRPFLEYIVAVGPHGSATPGAAIAKLDVDAVIAGECEEILPRLADPGNAEPAIVSRPSVSRPGAPFARHASNMTTLPALEWSAAIIAAHTHHHHRFDAPFDGPGAEMEASRGCPYHCTFCAKEHFRNEYRRRPLETILTELDGLLERGVKYVYFIDEIFLPRRDLLEALARKNVRIGVQTRIDLWNHEMIDLLAAAGCVSVEAGVESLTPEGRNLLDKKCRMTTGELSERLIYAKRRIPFVQGNLIATPTDHPDLIRQWRREMLGSGVWANDPVPLFPYPGSPDYTRLWGAPDDKAWERAHAYYLSNYSRFSDIQSECPVPLAELEQH